MGIVVACRCGQAFEADLYLAGKVVQCPACRSPIAVPTPPEEVSAPTYTPRTRPAISRAAKEANESLTTILVAGGALLVVVVGLSFAIICFLKGTNPIEWSRSWWGEGNPVVETPAEADVAGPVRIATPAGALLGLPEGWGFFEYPAGKFSALLPSSPEYSETRVEGPTGNQTIFTMATTQKGHIYEATREFRTFTISRGDEAAAYEALLKKRAAEMEEGKIEDSNNANVDGRLVCDAILRGKVEGTEFRKYLRLIADGDSVLELSCRVPPGKEQPAEIKLFLGNYKLPR